MNEKKNVFLKTMKQLRIGSFVTVLFFVLYVASMVLKIGVISDILAIAGMLIALYVMFSVLMYEGEDKTRSFVWGQCSVAILMMLFAYGTVRQWLGL